MVVYVNEYPPLCSSLTLILQELDVPQNISIFGHRTFHEDDIIYVS